MPGCCQYRNTRPGKLAPVALEQSHHLVGGPVFVILKAHRHAMPLEDRHGQHDSLVGLHHEALPLIEAGEALVAPPVQAGRAEAFGSGLARRGDVQLELGGVNNLRKADYHFEIHAQLLGALSRLPR